PPPPVRETVRGNRPRDPGGRGGVLPRGPRRDLPRARARLSIRRETTKHTKNTKKEKIEENPRGAGRGLGFRSDFLLFSWVSWFPGFPCSCQPAKGASAPISSSIRSSWLYFASRSLRATEPILICPAPVATARSAMVVSSVSPLRAEITGR